MLIPDKKKAATIILSSLGKPGSDTPVKPEEAYGDDTAFHAIAEDILQAVKSGSAADLASALRAFCSEHEVTEDPGEDTGD